MSCRCASDDALCGRPAISSVLSDLQLANFRCFAAASLEFAPGLNVFTGGNGAGKTSLLEAVFFLGRGRSFRTADNRVLVQSGASGARITGRVNQAGAPLALGIGITADGLEIHAGGRIAAGTGELIAALPVQAIHAEIDELVQGPPEARRRILDWGVFHVEHRYLDQWRRFRRALLQRNAALKGSGPDDLLASWEGELAGAADILDQQRAAYFKALAPRFRSHGEHLLGREVDLSYHRGWPVDSDLRSVLGASREGDRQAGFTRSGPQRADLVIRIDDERSRWRASKGQQKLLGAALVLAQCELAAEALGQGVALVLDEPAADLDRSHLAALMNLVGRVPGQVFLAALDTAGLALPVGTAMFHVEHGQAKALL